MLDLCQNMPKGTNVVCTYEAENRKQLLPESLIVQKYHHPKEDACSMNYGRKCRRNKEIKNILP